MDQTIRTPEQPSTTIRVAPLGKGVGDSTYVPGRDKPASSSAAGDFIIKGKFTITLNVLAITRVRHRCSWLSVTRNRWC